MRSKAPLLLMEQLVMLLVFALAAALCLRAFVKSDEISRRSEARDQAVIVAQTAAETLRWIGGDEETALAAAAARLNGRYEGGVLRTAYDETWAAAEGGSAYFLEARAVPAETPGLSRVQITVAAADGEPLFAIETAWQEVDAHAQG